MTPVKLIPLVKWPIIASLRIPGKIIFSKRVVPWVGWYIVFERYMTPLRISQARPFIESKLNLYLEKSVNVIANHLLIPFNCKMANTTNRLIYTFKVVVYTESPLGKIPVPFKYPMEPVNRLNNFFIEAVVPPDSPSNSHITTVTLKPPPN